MAENRPDGGFIPLFYHHYLLRDSSRTLGLIESIREVVKPGDRVLEIGCGTGILSWAAAKAGASVLAIEADERVAAAATRFLFENGVGSAVRVEVCDARGELDVGDRVDVVVCELIETGLVEEHQVPVLRALWDQLPTLPREVIPRGIVSRLAAAVADYSYHGFFAAFVRPLSKGDVSLVGPYLEYGRVDFFDLAEQEGVDTVVRLSATERPNAIVITSDTLLPGRQVLEASAELCWPIVVPIRGRFSMDDGPYLLRLRYRFGHSYETIEAVAL